MSELLLFCVVWLIAVVATALFIFRAPEGYEDRRGFHYGPEPRDHDSHGSE